MDTTKSSVPAHPDETPEEHPHACYGGLVYVGYLVEDPETGEEAEVFEAVACRRCADAR